MTLELNLESLKALSQAISAKIDAEYNPEQPGYHNERWTNRVEIGNLPRLCQRRDIQQWFQAFGVLDVNFIGPDRALLKCANLHQCQHVVREWHGRTLPQGQTLQVKLYFNC